MDNIGERIIKDRAAAEAKRKEAQNLESRARHLRWEAEEIERLLGLAMLEKGK